jgi:hypothetical protein
MADLFENSIEAPHLRWHELTAEPIVNEFCEFLAETPWTALDDTLRHHADRMRAEEPTPGEAVVAACALIRRRSGACQDISHIVVGLLRAMSIPARPVSDYPSHAWVEWWDGAWRRSTRCICAEQVARNRDSLVTGAPYLNS